MHPGLGNIQLNNRKQRVLLCLFLLCLFSFFLILGIILLKLFTEQCYKHVSQQTGHWGVEIQLAKYLSSQAGTALMPILPIYVELRL